MLRIDVITIFPGLFDAFLNESLSAALDGLHDNLIQPGHRILAKGDTRNDRVDHILNYDGHFQFSWVDGMLGQIRLHSGGLA